MDLPLKPPPLMSLTPKKNLHYYIGRVRAFWEDKIFFSDQRNVAIVNIQNLYLHGKRATREDVVYLEKRVSTSEWYGAPEFYSYVSHYPSEVPYSWPYKLSGKVMWQASYAWTGCMPEFIERDCQNDIVYMPVSYYTGKVIRCFEDKILFGDTRNNVMVNLEDFYIFGERASKKEMAVGFNKLDPIIHAYVTKLKVLAGANTKIIGPEPNLPTWPKQHYTSDTWVAKYAWQGEMPEVVKRQVGRFYMIHMNQWDNIGFIPWVKGIQSGFYNTEKRENTGKREILKQPEEKEDGESKISIDTAFIPVEQEAGIMKGSLLLANHHQGLLTSFVDVIAFTKENFYVNGEKFRSQMSLSDFFKSRKIPLTAWVVSLAKPKVIFHINVVWRAVCVWYGDTPKNLESLKKEYLEGKLTGNLVETINSSSVKKFTHFIGNITSLSFASGVLKSKVSLAQTVKISFKRRTLYMYGYKFHSSCRLLDKQQILESFTWSVLAFPIASENHPGTLQYHAIALWQFQYQNYITMNLFRIIAEANDPKSDLNESSTNFGNCSFGKEELGHHMSGWIVMVSEYNGIIQSGSNQVEATYIVFNKSILYVDGELLPDHVSLNAVDRYRQCNVYAKPKPGTYFEGLLITMEASMVWIGKKPFILESPIKGTANIKDNNIQCGNVKNILEMVLCAKPEESEISAGRKNALVESCTNEGSLMKTEDNKPAIELYAIEGIVAGTVLITDSQQGLMVCYKSIVAFNSKNFYIDGVKFDEQFTSLVEYFSNKNIPIRAWVVPLKEPRVLFNCQVVCEAVCVWIGQEPAELKNLESEKQIGTLLKESENDEESHFPEVVFTYLLGSVTNLSASTGLITCETPLGSVKVAFWNKSLFLNGAKLPCGKDLQTNNDTLTSSTWSMLAYPIALKEILGETIAYCALAVWHCTDQHKIRNELSQLTSTKTQDLPFYILPINIQRAITKGTMAIEGSVANSGTLMCGWIVFTQKSFGIIECVDDNTQKCTNVLFHRTMLWIDGQAVDSKGDLCLIDRSLQCTLYTGTHRERELCVCGYAISCIASVVWMGKKPRRITAGPYSFFSSSKLQLKIVKMDEAEKNVENKVLPELSEATIMQILEESGVDEIHDRLGDEKEEPVQKYCGKHITGRIIQKCKGGGVAQWHSIQLGGEVYIEFSRQDVYVDLSPVTKKTKMSALESRPCNFYVIPVPHHEVGEYTISLAATCGWIGSKPSHIPPPGTQELVKIDLSNVHVTPASVIQQQNSCSPNIQSGINSAQPGAVPKDKNLQVLGMNGQSKNQSVYDSHKDKSLIDNTTSSSANPHSHDKNRSKIWEEDMKENHLRGSIIELHSNVGRLQGADGSQHYFSRDHCYLYGVSLRCVELWHVLVQGEAVTYTTSEISPGTSKVQGVWVGAQKIGDVQKAAAHIYEWCKRNLVPDGARDLLVHQLEVS
ncbi:uncharacterized protein [Procambarus clarkii]|uniref:uncharacterized protein n=1 Tax=Procambarus clarkii TaxID=6728 RepID=UPI003743ED37